MYRILLLAVSMACSATASKAHEFWIDPVEFQVAAGEPVVADLRVGEAFEGGSYSYIPRAFRRFDFAMDGNVSPVEGTVGDRPAMTLTPEAEGLLVAIHVTTDQQLTWDEWDRFANFLKHKDAVWGLEEHAARGLSREKVREQYSRYAKSLVAVGHGKGKDLRAGLLTEIVALENPYTDDMSDGIDVVAYYDDEVLQSTQIEVFEKAPDGAVTIFTNRTDAEGRATIPVKPGYQYMLDAVVLRALEATQNTDPVWESLWANLTFEVPKN